MLGNLEVTRLHQCNDRSIRNINDIDIFNCRLNLFNCAPNGKKFLKMPKFKS